MRLHGHFSQRLRRCAGLDAAAPRRRRSLPLLTRLAAAIAPLLLCTTPAFSAPIDWQSTIQAFEFRDAVNPPPTGQVVVTGSSSIVLWDTMARDLEPLTVIARGFGGSTAVDLEYYLDRIVLKYAPRAVVIYEGDNDIGAGMSPASIAGTMSRILERISQRLPDTRVYIISVKLSPLRVSLGQAPLVRELNQRYGELCAADARYTCIDIMTPMLDASGAPVPACFQSDGLHLSVYGYQIWTAAVRKLLIPQQQFPRRPTPGRPLRRFC